MGNPKQKWTSEEEEALRAGVAKHGAGKWKLIQRDPEFNHLLHSRSNIDLKDKWRNLNVYPIGQNSRDKSRAPKVKANPESSVSPVPKAQTPASSIPASNDVAADTIVEDNIKCLLDGKTASKYDAIIYEALSSLKDPNGSDTSRILRFIEQRHDSHEVPPNFSRKVLSSRLRKLVLQEKLEKIENGFRIKKELLRSTKRKESWPIHNQNTCHLGDTVEEAAVAAAYRIAEAENKSFVAAEAVKEAERVSRMAEDSNVMLQLAKEIFEKCENGEIVLMA